MPNISIPHLEAYCSDSYPEDIRRYRDGRLHDGCICYAEPAALWRQLDRSGIREPDVFIVFAFIDSLLLAAVCTYDNGNYGAYEQATRYYERLGGVGGLQGLRLPQKILAAVPEWTGERLMLLKTCCAFLLPQWVRTYDQLVGRAGAGLAILARLPTDRDAPLVPPGVPPAAVQAYMDGIAEVLRGQGDGE